MLILVEDIRFEYLCVSTNNLTRVTINYAFLKKRYLLKHYSNIFVHFSHAELKSPFFARSRSCTEIIWKYKNFVFEAIKKICKQPYCFSRFFFSENVKIVLLPGNIRVYSLTTKTFYVIENLKN